MFLTDDPLSTGAEPAPHQAAAPARRHRGRSVRAEPRLAELTARRPDLGPSRRAHRPTRRRELAERFGWHPLDLEDVLSKRQRPKIDEYPEYLFGVLHFPAYDKTIQRLNAAELDLFVGPDFLITLPNVELLPVTRLFARCEDDDELRESLFSKGSGLPALPRPRRPLRLLLPDPRQDRAQARLDRGRDVRGPRRGRRPRPLEREAGDHLLPQDHQARALDAAGARAAACSATCPRSSTCTSTTSSTPPSGSGTSSTTTRRSSRRSSRRTSR